MVDLLKLLSMRFLNKKATNTLGINFTQETEIDAIVKWQLEGSKEGAFARSLLSGHHQNPNSLPYQVAHLIYGIVVLPDERCLDPTATIYHAGKMFSLYLNEKCIGFISYLDKNTTLTADIDVKTGQVRFTPKQTSTHIPIEVFMLFIDKQYRKQGFGTFLFKETAAYVANEFEKNDFSTRCMNYENSSHGFKKILDNLDIPYIQNTISCYSYSLNFSLNFSG